MGSPNSKSNSPEKKKEIPTKQDINETNNTNLEIIKEYHTTKEKIKII